MPGDEVWITVAGALDVGAWSGATAQPAGSLGADAVIILADSGIVAAADAGAEGLEVVAALDVVTSDIIGELSAAAPDDSRVKNAVTSPPVGTMATISQPCADFSVSLVARLAGS